MKKLRLDIDQVQVESFATGNGVARAGTVRAYGDTLYECTRLPCTIEGTPTDPLNCIEEPNPDTELSACEECITMDFPGMGYLTCTPD